MVFNQDGQSRLGRWSSSRPVSIFMLLVLVLYLWIEMREGMNQIAARPDLNGDGVFNLADWPRAAYAFATTIGDGVQSTALGMRHAEIAQFLQMSADPPNPFWSVFFSGFIYFLVYYFAKKSLQKH
jgi:hypothetical protein